MAFVYDSGCSAQLKVQSVSESVWAAGSVLLEGLVELDGEAEGVSRVGVSVVFVEGTAKPDAGVSDVSGVPACSPAGFAEFVSGSDSSPGNDSVCGCAPCGSSPSLGLAVSSGDGSDVLSSLDVSSASFPESSVEGVDGFSVGVLGEIEVELLSFASCSSWSSRAGDRVTPPVALLEGNVPLWVLDC